MITCGIFQRHVVWSITTTVFRLLTLPAILSCCVQKMMVRFSNRSPKTSKRSAVATANTPETGDNRYTHNGSKNGILFQLFLEMRAYHFLTIHRLKDAKNSALTLTWSPTRSASPTTHSVSRYYRHRVESINIFP